MRRRILLGLAIVIASGCQGDDATRPKLDPASSPATMKFDGNNHGGNPDFFFLPPLAADPKASSNFDPGESNVSLAPTVDVCALDVPAATQATMQSAIGANTPCKLPLVFTQTLGARNVSRGILDDGDIDLLHFIATHYPSLTEPYYHVGWKVPVAATLGSSTPPAFYRIAVRVGNKPLGFLDVESVNNFSQLINVNTREYVPLTGGLRLPINFRIENRALCEFPGDKTKTCASVAVDLKTGATVQTVLDPAHAPLPSGIDIPATPTSTGSPVNITVQSCPDLNPRATDLPTFGSCIRVTAEPKLENGFPGGATIFDCNVNDNVIDVDGANHVGKVRSHSQADRITLHQLDVVGEKQVLVALPHAPACGVKPPVIGSLPGMLNDLRHGKLREAAKQMVAMLAPKPLYAAKFIDLGGGGDIGIGGGLSDFQFALPAKFTIDQSTNNAMLGPSEAATPAVVVSDLGDEPVSGATVHFDARGGSAAPLSVVTGADGRASTIWTLGASGGTSSLFARGLGIAGSDNNGPREGIDPFQPIQSLFTPPLPTDPGVPVLLGSVAFSATALVKPIGGFGLGSDGFVYRGITPGEPLPSGWESASFATGAEWAVASEPWGTHACGLGVATDWAPNTGLLVRKTFSTRTAGGLSILVRIDNDVRLWLDGTEITGNGSGGGNNQYVAPWWLHDQCANEDPPTFTVVNVPAGNHLLAILATDRGGATHLDVSVSPTP